MNRLEFEVDTDDVSVELLEGKLEIGVSTPGVGHYVNLHIGEAGVASIRKELDMVAGKPESIQVQRLGDGTVMVWFDPIGYVSLTESQVEVLTNSLRFVGRPVAS